MAVSPLALLAAGSTTPTLPNKHFTRIGSLTVAAEQFMFVSGATFAYVPGTPDVAGADTLSVTSDINVYGLSSGLRCNH